MSSHNYLAAESCSMAHPTYQSNALKVSKQLFWLHQQSRLHQQSHSSVLKHRCCVLNPPNILKDSTSKLVERLLCKCRTSPLALRSICPLVNAATLPKVETASTLLRWDLHACLICFLAAN